MHTGSSQAATVFGSPYYLASGGGGCAVAHTLLFAGLAGAPDRGGGPGAGGGGQIAPATSEDRTPSPPQTELREATAGTTPPAPRSQPLTQEGPSCAAVPSPHVRTHTSSVTPQVWLIFKFTELKEENPPPPALL